MPHDLPVPRALAVAELRRACQPAQLPFETTAELDDFADVLGQARAVEAIRFGVAGSCRPLRTF